MKLDQLKDNIQVSQANIIIIINNDINFKIANNIQELNSVETFKYFRKLKDNY